MTIASRESAVSEAFVRLASKLTEGFDLIELVDDLTALSVQLLDVDSAGLLLADSHGVLHVLAASSVATRELEVIQLQRDEGPCLVCFDTGTPVKVPDLDEAASRWPRFAPAARAQGFVSVHALPLRLGERTLGTLGLFGTERGDLNEADMAPGQALADVASVSIVQQKVASDAERLNIQLQEALDSRVSLEQARGIVAQQGDVGMDEAFSILRNYARSQQLKLTDVANAVVQKRLNLGDLQRQPQSR